MTDFNLDEHIDNLMKRLPKSTYVEKSDLLELRNALLDGDYWTRVDSVSKSGMSRTIVCCYAKILDGHPSFRYVKSDILRTFAGVSKGGRVSGCGMDMLFQVHYELFHALCPDKTYETGMPQYNTLP